MSVEVRDAAEPQPNRYTRVRKVGRFSTLMCFRIGLDGEPELEQINSVVRDFLGYAPEELLGRPLSSLKIVHDEDLPVWRRIQRADESVIGVPVRLRMLHRSGQTVWTEQHFGPVRDESADMLALDVIAIDITERLKEEEAHRKNESRLNEAQEIAEVGNWELMIETRELWWSDETYRLLGYSPGEVEPTYELFLERLHPDDADNVHNIIQCAFAGEKPRSIQYRVCLEDGTEKVLRARARVEKDSDGKPIRLVGTSNNITAQNKAQEALELSEGRMRAILNVMPDMIFRVDADGVVLDYLGQEDRIRLAPEEFVGRSVRDFLPLIDADQTIRCIREAINTGEVQTLEMEYRPEDDEVRFLDIRHMRCTGNEAVVLVRDMTAQRAARDEIRRLKDELLRENRLLRQEVRAAQKHETIIGDDPALQASLKLAEKAAPTDVPVLLLGETGTGKELFARLIHNMSSRQDEPLVSVNCPALPPDIIESELFGHEKGAFTGAHQKRLGRFELADGGTLFLDEIGDLPLVLQGKLLRVLQEGRFERLGGSETIKVDVRLIAASNRDLDSEARDGLFRADLYYRIGGFPIHLPALRERRGDIPLLIDHFIRKHAERLGKQIESISPRMLAYLQEASWPGNVRELEGSIVRAIIFSSDGTLELPQNELLSNVNQGQEDALRDSVSLTLREAERNYILRALEARNWVITGDKGAASMLGLPPSTLRSRMKRLGIERPRL